MHSSLLTIALCFLSSMGAEIVLAQAPGSVVDGGPGICVRGSAVKMFEPTSVRVRYRIFATGKSAKSALTKLEANRSAIQAGLDSLKGDKPEVRISEIVPVREGGQSFQQRAMAMAMGGGDKKDDGTNKKEPTRLGFQVTMQWPLKPGPAAERLRQVDAIEEQLRELDLIDRKNSDGSADDEDEEDAEGDKADDKTTDAFKLDIKPEAMRFDAKPTFDYVYQVSDAEWEALAKAAFADAERSARVLAGASGRPLGALRSLSDGSAGPEGMFDQMQTYQQSMMDMFGEGTQKFEEEGAPDPRRLTSPKLAPMPCKYGLTATFHLLQ